MGTVHWIGLQIQYSMQIHCLKNIQFDMNYIFKMLDCIGQLGLKWMSPIKTGANEVEIMPTTNDIVSSMSPAA